MNTLSCPHCRAPYDASHRTSGDRVWCSHCGLWFLVTHRDGRTLLTRCEAPATWPRERKKRIS